MSSFARHLRTPSTRASRVGSSKSISFDRTTEKSSRLSFKSGSETKSMAVISEYDDGIMTPVN